MSNDTNPNLFAARDLIEQATGIIMERFELPQVLFRSL